MNHFLFSYQCSGALRRDSKRSAQGAAQRPSPAGRSSFTEGETGMSSSSIEQAPTPKEVQG